MVPEVLVAERELRRAVLTCDVEALARLLADEVLFIGPDGSVVDKAKDLEIHRSGAMRIVHYEPVGEPQVHEIAEGVCRLLTVIEVTVVMGETTHAGRYFYTRVYVRRGGRPQIALAQAAPALVE